MKYEINFSLSNAIILSIIIHSFIIFKEKKVDKIKFIQVPVDLIYEKFSPAKEEGIAERIKKIKNPEPVKKKKETKQKSKIVSPIPQFKTNISFDKDFPFLYYLKIIKKKIAANWVLNKKFGNSNNIIFFKISRSGEILDLKTNKSSNDAAFDSLAMRAIIASAPFPPLPEEYKEEFLGIYFSFESKINEY